MSGKSAGQLNYEARQVAKGRRMGAGESTPDSEILAVIALGWDELPPGMQADEEAGARAVLAPGRALADAWDAQARKCDEAAALPGLAEAAVLEQTTFARQLRECAAALREIAGEAT